MSKQSNNIPRRRFREFVDAPAWEQREFADTFNFISNNSLSRANLTDTKQEIKNIHYGDILIKYSELVEGNLHSIPFIRKEVPKKQINKDFLRKGDIIFADAAEDETVGKCIEIKSVGKHPIVSGLHTIAVRSMIKFESGFLGYYLNSNSFHGQLIRLMQGTKIPSVSKKHISNTYLRYPKNLKEQEQIATFLKTMTNTITLHQRKLDKLEKLKESYLDKLFPKEGEDVPELRFPGFTDPWEQRELGEIGNTYNGLSGKTKKDFGHGDAQYITYLNVYQNDAINPNQVEKTPLDPKQNKVKKGDIFFTTSSEVPEEVGMASVLHKNLKNTYLNSFCFGFRTFGTWHLSFMSSILQSEFFRKQVVLLAQGISRFNISKKKMMEVSLTFPSYKEQKQIGAFFTRLDNLITLHQRKLEKLEKIKEAFLSEMFV